MTTSTICIGICQVTQYILIILFVDKNVSTKSAEAKKSSQESSNKPESASSSKGDKSESKGDKSESKGDKFESKGDKSSTKTNKQEDEVKKRKKSPVPSSSKGQLAYDVILIVCLSQQSVGYLMSVKSHSASLVRLLYWAREQEAENLVTQNIVKT